MMRSLSEELARRHDVTVLHAEKADAFNALDYDIVISAGFKTVIPSRARYKVVIGLADPSRFQRWRIDAADLYATGSREIVHEFPDEAIYLPPCTDANYFQPMDLPRKFDCAMVGLGVHPRIKYRIQLVNSLRKAGLRVLTAGSDWPKHRDNWGFRTGPGLVKAFCVARFSLDITLKSSSLCSRIFQAASCGTPTITIDREDTRLLFEPDKEILFYQEAEVQSATEAIVDHVKKADWPVIGKRARARTLRDHDIVSRVDTLMAALEQRGVS
jgi:hypothetical protein